MTSRAAIPRQVAARDGRWAPGTRVARMPACMAAPMAGVGLLRVTGLSYG